MTSVPARLGRDLSGRDIVLDLAAPHHGLLSGRTRSGKSIALYVLLAQMKGKPVRVCGVDPSGIVFTALGPDPWRVVTMRDVDKAKAVLAEIVAEMDSRIDALLAAKLDKFTDVSEDMPLLLVVLEEFPAMLSVLKSHDAASGLYYFVGGALGHTNPRETTHLDSSGKRAKVVNSTLRLAHDVDPELFRHLTGQAAI